MTIRYNPQIIVPQADIEQRPILCNLQKEHFQIALLYDLSDSYQMQQVTNSTANFLENHHIQKTMLDNNKKEDTMYRFDLDPRFH